MRVFLLIVVLFSSMLPAYAIPNKEEQEIVVLVHGLMRTKLSMIPLKFFLDKRGYQAYLYSYPSTKYSIKEHGIQLHQYINKLIEQHPGVKVHFITHSLGGIICREALAKLNPSQLKDIGYLIMLAPPNQGSFLAKMLTKLLPTLSSTIKPMAELSSEESSYIHRVPIPRIKMGIIAGRFDAKVPPAYARLQEQNDLVIINAAHSFIMLNPAAKKLIVTFLKNGTFKA